MKKLFLLSTIFSVFIIYSCEKESSYDENLPNITSKESQDFSAYEYFKSPEKPQNILDEFITDERPKGNYPINNAIWLLEGALNYDFRHKPFIYESHETIAYEIELNLNEASEIDANDLKIEFTTIANNIYASISGEENAYLIADVSVTNLYESVIHLTVNVVYAQGINFVVTSLPTTPLSDRHDYIDQHCDGTSAPEGGDDYIEILALNKLINASSVPYHLYHFGLNVRSYRGSSIGGIYTIDDSYLFNQMNDSNFPYNGTTTCQEVAELAIYRDQVFNDISNTMSTNEHIFLLDIEDNHNFGGGSGLNDWHYYKKVNIGEVGYHNLGNPNIGL